MPNYVPAQVAKLQDDVIFEISTHLSGLDLLRIATTNTVIRELLEERTETVWKARYEHRFPEAPDSNNMPPLDHKQAFIERAAQNKLKVQEYENMIKAHNLITEDVANIIRHYLGTDREWVLSKLTDSGVSIDFMYVSLGLRSDIALMSEVVRRSSWMIDYVPRDLRQDRAIVLAQVKGYGRALEHLPDEFKSDKEIVLAAVQQCGYALQFAATELRADRDIVLAAVWENRNAFEFASEELRGDRLFRLASRDFLGQLLLQHFEFRRPIIIGALVFLITDFLSTKNDLLSTPCAIGLRVVTATLTTGVLSFFALNRGSEASEERDEVIPSVS
jgi:hypothetical protein